jgi:hypothetical protein
MDKNTKREEIKNMLKRIYSDVPEGRDRILNSIKNKEQLSLWFDNN